MRDVPLAAWTPTPHFAYFGHLASALDGTSVAFVLARAGSGRQPCRGADTDPDDDYQGDVLRDGAGRPMAGVPVQYFQVKMGGKGNEASRIVEGATATVETDAYGAHCVWLEPGVYEYAHLVAAGGGVRREVTVEKGFTVQWEHGTPDEPGVESDGVELLAREVCFVIEDIICEWSKADGVAFSWTDIEEVVAAACDKVHGAAAEVRQISCSPFARPDMMNALQLRGINAVDVRWREMQIATAYRNLNTLVHARLLEPLDHPAADHQVSGVRFQSDRRVATTPGVPRHLADARAGAFFFAAQAASFEAPGTTHFVVLGDALERNGLRLPRTPEQSFAGIREAFGLGAGPPPPMPTMEDLKKYGFG